MYLSRFGVKNYKCLGEIDIPLTPIHVLIGENDAGKTSLLEAMGALYGSSCNELSGIFPEPWTGRELVRHGASSAFVELEGEWSRQQDEELSASDPVVRYGFGLEFVGKGCQCSSAGDWIEDEGERKCLVPPGANSQRTYLPHYKSQGTSIAGLPEETLKSLASFLKPAHKYALNARAMALPAAFDTQRRFALDSDGFGLATLLDDILGYAPELFIELRHAFGELFPQFATVRVETQPAVSRSTLKAGLQTSKQNEGKGIYFETRGGQSLRAQQVSDGAILFLGFLALAHLPEPPTLLLIEEPENGIYPKRIGQVLRLLKELVYRTEGVRFPQIIMTTHSPYVASFFQPEEVTFLSRRPGEPDGPVRARPMRDAPNIQERLGSEFYLGELWYNLSEEDLFGEP